jgi:hypothetical protein
VLGLVASLATIVPFGIARGEGVVPDGQLWLPPLLVAGVVCLTLAAATTSETRLINGGSPTKGFLSHVEVGPFQSIAHDLAGPWWATPSS